MRDMMLYVHLRNFRLEMSSGNKIRVQICGICNSSLSLACYFFNLQLMTVASLRRCKVTDMRAETKKIIVRIANRIL